MNWREAVQAMLDGKKVTRFDFKDREEKYLFWDIDSQFPQYSTGAKSLNLSVFHNDCWEIYVPKIKLGPEHVGKRVRLKNGDIGLITKYNNGDHILYKYRLSSSSWHMESGRVSISHETDQDIVEILE